MSRPWIVIAAVVGVLAGCSDDQSGATSVPPVVTVAPPTAVMASSDTVASVPATPASTTSGAVTTSTAAPSAPGLDALLVPPTDVPLPVTVAPAERPSALCGVPLANLPIDARATRLVDVATGTAVTSWVEIHPNDATAATAFDEVSTALASCDWAGELPAQTRSTELATRFVDTPELLSALPACDQAVTGGVVRTTSDEAPVERREVLVVVVGCGDLVGAVRIDLLDQVPVDQQPWIGPLINAAVARVAAAA